MSAAAPANVVDYLDQALDLLDGFREVLDGQRDAWCNDIEDAVWMARVLVVLEPPLNLTPGQELQARLQAAGLNVTHATNGCPGLGDEYVKVNQRADLLRSVWGVG